MNHFHVGQKVVCINDKFKNVSIDQLIREGETYTIRWLGMYKHYVDGEFLGVKLEEIDRGKDSGPEGYGADDMPFRATRFRPLVSDPLAELRNLAVDPHGYKPDAPEGPVHPDGPLPEVVREKEEVE